MTGEELVERLQRDNKVKRNTHRLKSSLSVAELATWRKNPGGLPAEHIALLQLVSGRQAVGVGGAGARPVDLNVEAGARERTFGGHRKARVDAVAVSRDGQRILSGGDDGYLRLWEAASGAEVANFSEFQREGWCGQYTVTLVAMTERHAVCGNVRSTVRIFELP